MNPSANPFVEAADADPHTQAAKAAKDLFQALLLEGVPWEPRVDAMLLLYRSHLTADRTNPYPVPHPDENAAPTTEELDETARFIAERSGHNRYVHDDGWKLIRTTEDDLDFAYNKAVERVGPDERDLHRALRAARKILKGYVTNLTQKR